MMTAVSFIIGIMPMMLATGAGAQSRRIIGTTVFSGMLVATMVGILFIPSLYVLFQRMREWAHRRVSAALPVGNGILAATTTGRSLSLWERGRVSGFCVHVAFGREPALSADLRFADFSGNQPCCTPVDFRGHTIANRLCRPGKRSATGKDIGHGGNTLPGLSLIYSLSAGMAAPKRARYFLSTVIMVTNG